MATAINLSSTDDNSTRKGGNSSHWKDNSSMALCQVADPGTSRVVHYTTAVFVLVVAVAATVGISLILSTVHRSRHLHRPLFLLLFAFCVSDLVFVTVGAPLQAVLMLTDGEAARTAVCDVISYVTLMTNSTSSCIIALMALYRDIQVCHSRAYRVLQKPRWILCAVVICWLLPLIFALAVGEAPVYEVQKMSCQFSGPYLYFSLAGVLYIPATMMVVISYLHIYCHVRRSRRRVQNALSTISGGDASQMEGDSGSIQNSPDQVVFRLTLIIFLEFFLFFIGPGVLHTIYIYVSTDVQCGLSLSAQIISKGRPLANVITCYTTNRELRLATRSLVPWCRPSRGGNRSTAR